MSDRMIVDISKKYPPIPDHVRIFYVGGFSSIINYHINGRLKLSLETSYWCEACGFDAETTMFWLLKYGHTMPTSVRQL